MRLALLVACVLLASACASWRERGVVLSPPAKLKAFVAPVAFDVPVRRLKHISDAPPPPGTEAERQAIAAETVRLSTAMARSLTERLAGSYLLQPVADPKDADVTLRLTVLGYGRIKRSWLALLVGSGLVEGTVQGVVVAEAAGSLPAAIGVAAEEALQETVEWVGGALVLDHYFTPVILRLELDNAKDGRRVWRKWAWDTIDRKALKALPVERRKRKEVRLWTVFEGCRDKLARALEKAALKNSPERGP